MSYFNQLNAKDNIGNILFPGSRVANGNKIGVIQHIVTGSNPHNPTCVVKMLDKTVVTVNGKELIKC